jgi:hypothetical protein
MLRDFPLLVCVAAAIALPAVVGAQTPSPKSEGPPPYIAEAFLGLHPLGAAKPSTIRSAVDLSSLRAAPDRPYAYASAARGETPTRTAIDHRFAPDGLTGSVGFVCDNDGHPPAPHESGVIAGYQEGRLVGATLSYPFK